MGGAESLCTYAGGCMGCRARSADWHTTPRDCLLKPVILLGAAEVAFRPKETRAADTEGVRSVLWSATTEVHMTKPDLRTVAARNYTRFQLQLLTSAVACAREAQAAGKEALGGWRLRHDLSLGEGLLKQLIERPEREFEAAWRIQWQALDQRVRAVADGDRMPLVPPDYSDDDMGAGIPSSGLQDAIVISIAKMSDAAAPDVLAAAAFPHASEVLPKALPMRAKIRRGGA